MTAPQVPINPVEPPQRSDPLNYDAKADAMMIYIPPMVDGINEVANFVNEKSDESLASSISSELSSQASQAAANYEEQWTGSSIKGRSYLYNGEIYLALKNSTAAPSNDGINWLQTLASVRQSWSIHVGYALGHRAVISGQQYVATQASGPNNGGAVNPSTDTDWSHWKPVWALSQVENRLKSNQNWNIPGRTGHPLPDATPRDYPVGAEIALGIFCVSVPILNMTYIDGVISADSGNYRVDVASALATDFAGVKLDSGTIIKSGAETTDVNGIAWSPSLNGQFLTVSFFILTSKGIPRGAHKFAGCSELPGVWPDVSDEESIQSAFGKLGVNQDWIDVSASRQIGVTYENATNSPILVSVIIGNSQGSSSPTNNALLVENSAGEFVRVAGETDGSNAVDSTWTAIVSPYRGYKVLGDGSSGINMWSELRGA